ncbi:hypothetical protein HDV05_004105 [Chytridiales sp. JEL 0842]|nr:hypothetical protein HDV05_004105 [Chytridiales sp. JEL 0842]
MNHHNFNPPQHPSTYPHPPFPYPPNPQQPHSHPQTPFQPTQTYDPHLHLRHQHLLEQEHRLLEEKQRLWAAEQSLIQERQRFFQDQTHLSQQQAAHDSHNEGEGLGEDLMDIDDPEFQKTLNIEISLLRTFLQPSVFESEPAHSVHVDMNRKHTPDTNAWVSSVSQIAAKGIDLLFKAFKSGKKGVRGQRLDERVKSEMEEGGVRLNNDDLILECCRYCQYRLSTDVYLLTEDKNLSLKAMVHGIQSVSGFRGELETVLGRYEITLVGLKTKEKGQVERYKDTSNVSIHARKPLASTGLSNRRADLKPLVVEAPRNAPEQHQDVTMMDLSSPTTPTATTTSTLPKTHIPQPHAPFVDEVKTVMYDILAHFLPTLKPPITQLLHSHGISTPPNLQDYPFTPNTSIHRPPPTSEEESLLLLIHTHFPTLFSTIYPPTLHAALPSLMAIMRDMTRARDRGGRYSVPKGDLKRFLEGVGGLWDVWFVVGGGGEGEGVRGRERVEGWKRVLGV